MSTVIIPAKQVIQVIHLHSSVVRHLAFQKCNLIASTFGIQKLMREKKKQYSERKVIFLLLFQLGLLSPRNNFCIIWYIIKRLNLITWSSNATLQITVYWTVFSHFIELVRIIFVYFAIFKAIWIMKYLRRRKTLFSFIKKSLVLTEWTGPSP